MRTALDEAAAASGRYVRLASASLGLAAPDQAVVAGFERSTVCSDPLESIVEFGVQPARAFTDHAFALQVHGRTGAQLALGPARWPWRPNWHGASRSTRARARGGPWPCRP